MSHHRAVVIERPVDCGGLYDSQRRELVDLLRSLNDAELATMVPATPACRHLRAV